LRRSPRQTLALATLGLLALAATRDFGIVNSGDARDPDTGAVLEIVPGAPHVRPGPSGIVGAPDTIVDTSIVGDLDLVLRTGVRPVPVTAPGHPSALLGGEAVPQAVAEPFGRGAKVPFQVTGATPHPLFGWNHDLYPYGVRTFDDLDGVHVAVAAFADLDGDGYVGVTQRDRDPSDREREEAEWAPVGRHIFIAETGVAQGELSLAVGGPSGAPLRVALVAAAWLGRFHGGHFGGAIPDGPAVFTALPFHPLTDPADVIGSFIEAPDPGNPLELLGVQIAPGLRPDPDDPRVGEAFTIALDGTTPSVDVADAHSGAPAGFALARPSNPQRRYGEAGTSLRPGLDPNGARTLWEIHRSVAMQSDGHQTLRLLPVDRLGNVADLTTPVLVTLSSGGWLQIDAPDGDGNDYAETVLVSDSRGVAVTFERSGEDGGPGPERLVIESAATLSAVDFHPSED
jgi:hypothetical protein